MKKTAVIKTFHHCPAKMLDIGLKPNSNGHPLTSHLSAGLKDKTQRWRALARISRTMVKMFESLFPIPNALRSELSWNSLLQIRDALRHESFENHINHAPCPNEQHALNLSSNPAIYRVNRDKLSKKLLSLSFNPAIYRGDFKDGASLALAMTQSADSEIAQSVHIILRYFFFQAKAM